MCVPVINKRRYCSKSDSPAGKQVEVSHGRALFLQYPFITQRSRTPKKKTMQHYLYVRSGRRYIRLNFSELVYVKSRGAYIECITETGSLLIQHSLGELLEQLPETLFCRIHHSYIVGLNKIQAFDQYQVYLIPSPARKVNLPLALPVGDKYRQQMRKQLPVLCGRKTRVQEKTSGSSIIQHEPSN